MIETGGCLRAAGKRRFSAVIPSLFISPSEKPQPKYSPEGANGVNPSAISLLFIFDEGGVFLLAGACYEHYLAPSSSEKPETK